MLRGSVGHGRCQNAASRILHLGKPRAGQGRFLGTVPGAGSARGVTPLPKVYSVTGMCIIIPMKITWRE